MISTMNFKDFILIYTGLVNLVSGNRLKNRIYTDVSSNDIRSCFRRLNGTSSIGCQSSIQGDVGVLIYIDTLEDITQLKDETFAPYTILVNPAVFSDQLLYQLESLGHVSGVILPSVTDPDSRWYGATPPGGYSDDAKCPAGVTHCTDQSPWNTAGSGLMWRNFDFPIFYVKDSNRTEELYQCYQTHNDVTQGLSWPLCSVQMSANMHAAQSSETCIRRTDLQNQLEPTHFCDPLSDVNLHYFVTPRNKSQDSTIDNVIVVTARLDGLTMFDQTEVGFDSPSTGLVTLLATANMVAQTIRQADYHQSVTNILFLLLNGESFDHTGAIRLLYDMEHDSFPKLIKEDDMTKYTDGVQPYLNIDNIAAIIELGQLSNKASDNVYIHSANTDSSDIVEKIKKYASDQGLKSQESSRKSLPPTSIGKFIEQKSDLKAVFISNFDDKYSNQFYHSLYDTAEQHGYSHDQGPEQTLVQHLTRVAVTLARTVVSVATGGDQVSGADKVPAMINDMLQCYNSNNWNVRCNIIC